MICLISAYQLANNGAAESQFEIDGDETGKCWVNDRRKT